MGFGQRLRKGLGDLISGGNQISSGRLQPHNSLNVHSVQYAASLSLQGGFSQPVWAPELSTVGSYAREGYTSRTFDTPTVPFSTQVYYAERDEDVALGLNDLTSKITGGAHYWKSEVENVQEMMSQFSRNISFDWIDTILVKEVLAYGNSFWKARMGIKHIRNKDDLMNIPISSAVRIWWDRQRRPYKYEFRGSEYQGYHNVNDIMHFLWNPINASMFGTGVMTSLCATKDFDEITPTGLIPKKLPSLMDRKYSTAMNMHLTERRYTPHNVYVAEDASQEERNQLTADLGTLDTGEDIVVGRKVTVQELGSAARAFNPEMFTNLVEGNIQKGLGTFRGKQGSESSHQYANAKDSSEQTEIGLASFPLAITKQLEQKLFQPWYESQGGTVDNKTDMYGYPIGYGGGIIAVPWEEANPEINFGSEVKQELETADQIKLIEMAFQSGAVMDPVELRQLLEDAGLNLRQEVTDQMNQTYNNTSVMPPYMQQQPNFNTYRADQAPRPMDNPNYSSSNRDAIQSMDATLGDGYGNIDSQPSDPRLNWTRPKTDKSLPDKIKKSSPKITSDLPDPKLPEFDNLKLSDVNALLAATGTNETTEITETQKIIQEAALKKVTDNFIREGVMKVIKKLEEDGNNT